MGFFPPQAQGPMSRRWAPRSRAASAYAPNFTFTFFCIDVTLASFQTEGTFLQFNDLLNIIESGLNICCFASFRTRRAFQSGPGVTFVLSFSSVLMLISPDRLQELREAKFLNSLFYFFKPLVSSNMETDAKNQFSRVPFSFHHFLVGRSGCYW